MIVREIVAWILVGVGLAAALSGAVGILRMPDVYTRIQCSSKTVTLGAIPMLVGLVVMQGPITPYGSRALVVLALLLVLNPVANHSLGRAAYKAGTPMWEGSVVDEPGRLERDDGRSS